MKEERVAVAALDEVPPGRMKCVQFRGRSVLLANAGGRIYGADGVCTHEDASLCTGSLQSHYVKCPLHGSRFDLVTGEPQEDPAEEPLRVYAVAVENGQILLNVDWNQE